MLSIQEDLQKQLREENLDSYEEKVLDYNIGDKRLNERANRIFSLFEEKPGYSILQTSGNWKEAKAIYRFLDNPKVTHEKLLKPHKKETAEKIRQEQVILSIQDTSTLDYSTRNEIEGMGNQGNTFAEGFELHTTLAVTTQGTPLGLIDFQCWTREKIEPENRLNAQEKKQINKKKPIEEKESYKWIKSFFVTCEMQKLTKNKYVCVSDRESDIFDLFFEREKYLEKEKQAPDLLIRARNNRMVYGDLDEKNLMPLWDYVEKQESKGEIKIEVPRNKKLDAREARLEVKFCEFIMKPPVSYQKKFNSKKFSVYAVYTKEIDPPKNIKDPISWMLITTIPVLTLDDALEKIQWYQRRWIIEVYFKVLKSGCKTEERQLRSVDRLIKVVAIDSIIAWKILFLTMMGREYSSLPANIIFEEFEWKALHVLSEKTTSPPDVCPSIGTVILQIAKLGGFLARKSDGSPGPQVMFRGMQMLSAALPMYLIYNPTYG